VNAKDDLASWPSLKLGFALWTRRTVQERVGERFDRRLSLSTAGRYLKHWGFTPQKPLRRAYEQDPAAVQHRLEVEYPKIRKRAKRENAEIHWEDEMGLRSDHQAGTSYGRKGQTPVIPGTGKRFSCHLISTITNRAALRFIAERRDAREKPARWSNGRSSDAADA
jgi:hypothetical protein